MTYSIKVRFKSNEMPWSGGHTPLKAHQPKDEEAAVKWAMAMAKGLGSQYEVQLLEDDDRVIPIDRLPDSL